MTSVSPLELRIIEELLIKEYGLASPLLRQLATVRAGVRQMTGTGYYLDLLVGENVPGLDRMNGDASDGYKTKLASPADLVGFTIFVRDGYLSWFEGYTFGDAAWPDGPIEKWLRLEAHAGQGVG
ncbi:MAG TPA: hypothetical protein VHW66_05775 [Stellaceae bacterium]|jgi:hypothetical protein|nr:hypothetical protein [Stellaceae bacterium]